MIRQCSFCGCEDVPDVELTLDLQSSFETIKGLRVIGWKCSQCGEEYYDYISVRLLGILRELVEEIHPPFGKEEGEGEDRVCYREVIKEKGKEFYEAMHESGELGVAKKVHEKLQSQKTNSFNIYQFAKYINELKQRFFEQDDLDFMLNKSVNNDRFSSALFLYSLTEHKLLMDLFRRGKNNSFVRVQLRNLHFFLNEETFDYEEINNLSVVLSKRLHAWGGYLEDIKKELPDERLETMKKMYYDLYLTYRADRPISAEETEHIKKVLGPLYQDNEDS